MKYNHNQIEKKWQKAWKKKNFRLWQAENFSKKKKFYILDMFPYPSGDGLHVGHIEGYTATDIYSRFLRMQGLNVLHPMGWDAFGLPAENYAIKNKVHPLAITQKNINHFREQSETIGLSYDWTREVSTCDPEYYKWTQWIVLKMFEKGLAYQSIRPINWCPSCKTGLANEDLENGRCERCKSEIERRPMRQWFLKITDYADRLLQDLKPLNWPEGVKEMQKNWIGKSFGYEFEFASPGIPEKIKVFTTRLDTIFGVTFLVLAPEHPLVNKLTTAENRERVRQYVSQSKNKTELAREAEKEKTGVFTGSYVVNPANHKRVPVWVADYVMMTYGTGAVMGVPAHDERDFAFAKKFALEIIEVISPDGQEHLLDEAYTDVDDGVLIHSGPFDRTPPKLAQEKIANFMNAKKAVHYKLEDWGFDRQRYWGEPMPLVYCENCHNKLKNANYQLPITNEISKIENWKLKIGNLGFSLGEAMNPGWIGLKEKDLPLTLPKVKYYEPTGTGESPLANIESWVNVKCPNCGSKAKRETNTMPQWAGSCWYYLAFALGNKQIKLKASQAKKFWDRKILEYWSPVDFYVGGVEHATRHLIYARFWHKFLFDLGVLPDVEPFAKLVNQGLISGSDGEKMSKSRGNVVNPDEIVKKFGADSVRIYEMFMGPLEAAKPWDTNGIVGIYRFLNRVWQTAINLQQKTYNKKQKTRSNQSTNKPDKEETNKIKRLLHQTIKKVTEDIKAMQFNTAISAQMEFLNGFIDAKTRLSEKDRKDFLSQFILLLYPFAPHLASEVWSFSNKTLIESGKWPKFDEALFKKQSFVYAIQVNGKIRDTLTAPLSMSQEEIVKKSSMSPKVSKWLQGKKLKQTIFVKDKIVNFVV
ncbi:MAG: Leucine-tRNA ligase [Parcubacteria group bacterium GW2011_GWC1_45_9]|nr:MAG: Leucine-tRNA ligase [Parcubacteria group bacterium GW2011_GWB1_45_10]KKU17376.1 MAG: Leucine-tRNA ligase [Parcubacteria group bacterium GW2011_GWC1_45_9]